MPASVGTLPGRPRAAQRALSGACRKSRAACAEIRLRAHHGRPQAAAARELCARAHRAARRNVDIDESKRPFVIVDPRAGHGPGIGGFKAQSEIGVAFKAGHPCYFIGFLPDPVPGQTIEDIARAEAAFLERVIALHPQAEGKPAVIGNCQAGWAVMMLAAMQARAVRPDHRCRLAAVLLGRRARPKPHALHRRPAWRKLAHRADGRPRQRQVRRRLARHEFREPQSSQHLWTKHYNLYSKVDTEAPRYLEFEQWWGGHVLLNAEEMQFIADELFVGNKLASGRDHRSDGTRIDLRNIRSPIVVFCSKADNITPPQQALDWILDLYESVEDMRAHGQTIVYAVHELIGHLGIFVSGSVAKKEHDEFASNIDLIDVLPPGLYEAVMTPKDPDDA